MNRDDDRLMVKGRSWINKYQGKVRQNYGTSVINEEA